MERKEFKENWYLDLVGNTREVSAISYSQKKQMMERPVDVPPFTGISRKPLLTKKDVCARLGCGSTFLDKKIRDKMIYPQPVGGRIKFAEEEYENYLLREQLAYRRKHA